MWVFSKCSLWFPTTLMSRSPCWHKHYSVVMEGTDHVPRPGVPRAAWNGSSKVRNCTHPICYLAAYETTLLVQMGTGTPWEGNAEWEHLHKAANSISKGLFRTQGKMSISITKHSKCPYWVLLGLMLLSLSFKCHNRPVFFEHRYIQQTRLFDPESLIISMVLRLV